MRVCLFSKYGESTNLLYEGVRTGLRENNIDFLDINISLERGEPSSHWINIPTVTKKQSLSSDAGILKKIELFKPNLIFLLQYSGLQFLLDNGDKIRQIIGKNGKIAFWFVDLAQKINENRFLGQYIDFFFLSNFGQLSEYQKKWSIKNTYFMPQGCFLAKELPKDNEYLYDLGFLGRRQTNDPRYQKRNEILDAFSKKFSVKESDKTLTLESTIGFYQTCKINLGLSWRNDVMLYSSDRIFNVLGAGGFYLCSYFSGMEKLFKNHKHLVWFKSINDGLEQSQFYLDHEDKRKEIIEAGYFLVKTKHTYQKRVVNVFDIIYNKIGGFKGFI